MIVSASYRTDIPAFYGEWFAGRLEAGFAEVANPYGGPQSRVPLAGPGVDGFVFWTRNAAPFHPVLDRLAAAGTAFAISYTITGYPRPLEAGVPEASAACRDVAGLAAAFGGRRVVWRYDPVFLSDLTDERFHRDNFRHLRDRLADAVDEVVLSFAQIYRKTARNAAAGASQHGFAWSDPEAERKRDLLRDLAAAAAEAGLTASLCAQPDLLVPPLVPARCIDAARLSDIAGRPIAARIKGNRPGCECAESRDIGAYDTCPHGCVYCYAVSSRARAKRALAGHDPAAPGLAAGR